MADENHRSGQMTGLDLFLDNGVDPGPTRAASMFHPAGQ
jgi:hypothetical protein